MYRYSKEKYGLSLLSLGIIRIGTLHDFRQTEHGQGIADPNEGKKTVSHHIHDLHIPDSNDPKCLGTMDARALGEFNAVQLGPNCKDITFENVTVSKTFDQPDCYVLCFSENNSKRTMKEFEGADSCIQVIDERLFFVHLTDALNSVTPVNFRGVHKVIYKPREEQWNGANWGNHPALIKEPEFGQQFEIRAIWTPTRNQAIQPVIIANHKLVGTCSRVSVLE